MILCDTNVWLALVYEKHVHHRACLRWFDGVNQAGSVFFCRSTQQGLLRLLTHAPVFAAYRKRPLTNGQSWQTYEALLADDRVDFYADEPADLESHWKQLALRETASPKLWMDAYLAAFAINARLQLVTTDEDFRQFRGLDHHVLG